MLNENSHKLVTFVRHDSLKYLVLDVIGDVLADGSSDKFAENIKLSTRFPNRPLILNFEPQVRVDSSGLAMLIDFVQENETVEVVICGNNESVNRWTDITGFYKDLKFRHYDTIDEALRAYEAKSTVFA